MNQTDQFLKAMKDIEEGKVVPLDQALNEEYKSIDVDLALEMSKLVHNQCKDVPHNIGLQLVKLIRQGSSEQLQKIFKDIEQMDAEREAWKRMFDLQTRLVTNLELDKIKLEKEIDGLKETIKLQKHVADVGAEELEKEIKGLKKEVQMYKDIVRLSDHLQQEKAKRTKYI